MEALDMMLAGEPMEDDEEEEEEEEEGNGQEDGLCEEDDETDEEEDDDNEQESCGPAMEECLLAGELVSLPETLLESPELWAEVLSADTWREALSDAERARLWALLPSFPAEEAENRHATLRALFSGENFRFGNPLESAQRMFQTGFFSPEVVHYRALCRKAQYKRYLRLQQQRTRGLLREILLSRHELLQAAARHQPADSLKRKRRLERQAGREGAEAREERVRKRFRNILNEIREECGDPNPSSDEDEEDPQLRRGTRSPVSTTAAAPRVLPTLCTQDMKTLDREEMGDEGIKSLMKSHLARRKIHPDDPALDTSELTLGDILTRMNVPNKKGGGTISEFAGLVVPRRRMKEEKRRRGKIKQEGDVAVEQPSVSPDGSCPVQEAELPSVTPKAEVPEDLWTSERDGNAPSCFFGLLRNLFLPDGKANSAALEEGVSAFLTSPAAQSTGWVLAGQNWQELVPSSLQFLAGDASMTLPSLPPNFAPYVDYKDRLQQWKWIGGGRDSNGEMEVLCQLWLETKDQSRSKEREEGEILPPTPRVRTDYVVRPSTEEEKRVFQERERQRYSQPHKAFTFCMHGFESVVGPVKGVFDKETALNKAREHSLLRSDRPAYVTILSLVRDAAARLPNGEGTRAEICELLKDSQFLASDVTNAQINTVVSGALDRLHYEKDPCVKYDIGRKLWIYLHRNRSQEEFERIHQAQAAAAKAKKALQQKPKPPGKGKSGFKEIPMLVPPEGNASSLEPSTPPTPTLSTTSFAAVSAHAAISKIITPKVEENEKAQPESKAEPSLQGPSPLCPSLPVMPQISGLIKSPQTPSSEPLPVKKLIPPTPTAQQLVASHHPEVNARAPAPDTPTPHTSRTVIIVTSAAPSTPAPAARVSTATVTVSAVTSPSVATVSIASLAASVALPAPTFGAAISAPLTVVSKGLAGASVHSATPATSAASAAVSKATPSTPVIVSVTGTGPSAQLKTQTVVRKVSLGAGKGVTASNLRIQGKDVTPLPLSTVSLPRGQQVTLTTALAALPRTQTVLRLPHEMAAALSKGQLTTLKVTPELLSSLGVSRGMSGTAVLSPQGILSSATVIKATPEMPDLDSSPGAAVKMLPRPGLADPKPGVGLFPASGASSAATLLKSVTVSSLAGLGHAQTFLRAAISTASAPAGVVKSSFVSSGGITYSTPPHARSTVTSSVLATQPSLGGAGPATGISGGVAKPGAGTAGMRAMPELGIIVGAGEARAGDNAKRAPTVTSARGPLGAAGAAVASLASIGLRPAHVTATVVSHAPSAKVTGTITLPISNLQVLGQHGHAKGGLITASAILKGSLPTSGLGGLGRNIILTTMPAGAKLLPGHKPVSYITQQQLQQLQQQQQQLQQLQQQQLQQQQVRIQQLPQGTVVCPAVSMPTVVMTTESSTDKQPPAQLHSATAPQQQQQHITIVTQAQAAQPTPAHPAQHSKEKS
ncbi:nuclear factor related to kappa-B-binding protein [Lethenteron reissneri]|uniref:nuclear factor related to kappa-B-binding protein n=1 Tax=Lethenteron reissneri TaxID=7753 RepID=UPI002AB60F39|nr:nuclear factor related to kappa-B-binding protein [Lethenteron reissneri]XP_061406810.1 nuclear factor related to kappa-B-binding protein [Lethenteron reissneri]